MRDVVVVFHYEYSGWGMTVGEIELGGGMSEGEREA